MARGALLPHSTRLNPPTGQEKPGACSGSHRLTAPAFRHPAFHIHTYALAHTTCPVSLHNVRWALPDRRGLSAGACDQPSSTSPDPVCIFPGNAATGRNSSPVSRSGPLPLPTLQLTVSPQTDAWTPSWQAAPRGRNICFQLWSQTGHTRLPHLPQQLDEPCLHFGTHPQPPAWALPAPLPCRQWPPRTWTGQASPLKSFPAGSRLGTFTLGDMG